ncbi:MAG TPA: hypothetical protein ENH26_02210 [Candidatus Wolfebacteria bacterium]|nr:hypothetical protein [Candidatus Wolfebacteria bacterium]
MKKVKVGIIGHTGRLGTPLVEILQKHPLADIVYTESRNKGFYGSLAKAEIIFLAVPYGESTNYLSKLKRKKIIDLSIDHRNKKGWSYGLPEIFRNEIKNAKMVANPGCYATSILLALYPLKNEIKSIRISSTSGMSGAGIAQKKEENFLIYKEGDQHPQIQEITKILGVKDVLFIPQRIDSTEKGIVSTIFVNINDKLSNIHDIYKEFYRNCRFIRIRDEIETRHVVGTNFCDMKIMEFQNDILIISALDNIIKGGVGQAIQNFNLMYGIDEVLGLIGDR